jgi:capsular polysaccharide biosynthesis protein
VALVAALAAAGGALALLLIPRQYSAEVRLLLNREPVRPPLGAPAIVYDDYYRFLGTEFVLDDTVERVKGNRFAQAVRERLEAGGGGWSDERVMRSLKPERAHRILTVEVTADSRDRALRLKEAVEAVLTGQPELLAPPDGSKINLQVIHSDPLARSDLARSLLIYVLQLLLALLLGGGLAFLLHYLDDRVRGEPDLAALGVPVLGRLPAPRPAGRAR